MELLAVCLFLPCSSGAVLPLSKLFWWVCALQRVKRSSAHSLDTSDSLLPNHNALLMSQTANWGKKKCHEPGSSEHTWRCTASLQPLLVRDPRACLSPQGEGLSQKALHGVGSQAQPKLPCTQPSTTPYAKTDILLPMPLGRQSEKIKFALRRVEKERCGTSLMWKAQWKHLK